jgi:hypothetical protein
MLAIDDIIKQPGDLFTGALEAVRHLHDARLEAGVAAMTLADLERRLRIEQAAAEIRAIQEAGGDEKALGSNAEARARALAVAVDKDPQYRAALDAVHEAYLRKIAADAVAEAAKEYLAVLKAALREV